MVLTLFVLLAATQQSSTPEQLMITSGRAQIGCATVEQFAMYHSSSYEKDGATPRTEGCVRVEPKTPVKDLGKRAEAKISGDKIPVRQYEGVVGGKTLQFWLSPSAVEKQKKE